MANERPRSGVKTDQAGGSQPTAPSQQKMDPLTTLLLLLPGWLRSVVLAVLGLVTILTILSGGMNQIVDLVYKIVPTGNIQAAEVHDLTIRQNVTYENYLQFISRSTSGIPASKLSELGIVIMGEVEMKGLRGQICKVEDIISMGSGQIQYPKPRASLVDAPPPPLIFENRIATTKPTHDTNIMQAWDWIAYSSITHDEYKVSRTLSVQASNTWSILASADSTQLSKPAPGPTATPERPAAYKRAILCYNSEYVDKQSRIVFGQCCSN